MHLQLKLTYIGIISASMNISEIQETHGLQRTISMLQGNLHGFL